MLLRLRRELRDERTGASRNHCQVDAHNLALNTQGFDLNQLLGGAAGGGGSRHQHTDPGQGNGSGISVQRSAPPLTGKFSGKQDDKDAETTLTAQFACYPASDSEIPQAKAYVCYTGGSNGGPRTGDPPAYGSPAGRFPYGPPSGGDPSNGPPSGVE